MRAYTPIQSPYSHPSCLALGLWVHEGCPSRSPRGTPCTDGYCRAAAAALQRLNGMQYEGRIVTVKYDKFAQ